MSYPVDLDEYTDEALLAELGRRAASRARNLCDYCGRPPSDPPCKFPLRHRAAVPPPSGEPGA